jgi:hypothetical protein
VAARSARRGGVALLVVLITVVAAVLGARALWHVAKSLTKSIGCTFGDSRLDLGQSEVASTMVSVVIRRSLPERAAVLTLGAALQESKLRNIASGQGDRDSVGVLQQRPSQGWGSSAQLADVSYATGKFLDALVKLPNWQTDTMAKAIQDVQISADGAAYAKHESQAKLIADALMGRTAAGVSCSFDKPTAVAAPATVAAKLSSELPVGTPTTDGKSVRVPGASWATAAWFITHGNTFGIDVVGYAGKRWSRSDGWKDDATIAQEAVTATLHG